jgi:hypothetical protein
MMQPIYTNFCKENKNNNSFYAILKHTRKQDEPSKQTIRSVGDVWMCDFFVCFVLYSFNFFKITDTEEKK